QHELDALGRRIHILEGFEKVFDALDQILRIIRKSEGKADAAQQIMKRFDLDAEQTDAILELKLYRLARLEILVIQKELKDKRKRAKEIRGLLAETASRGRWALVRGELEELAKSFGKAGARRTRIEGTVADAEFSEEELIVAEDNYVLLTVDGWVKRQKEIKDPSATRLREGDSVLACEIGSTRESIVFFSNFGTAYTARIIDIPATTGYGEPIQKLFKLKDGERIVAAFSLDPRVARDIAERANARPKQYAVAATSDGYALAFGLSGFVEPSTRAGRRFAKLGEGATVVGVDRVRDRDTLIAATRERRALLCPAAEVSYLAGPGRGVLLLKLEPKDAVIGFRAARSDDDALVVETSLGGQQRISPAKYEVSSRGGRGREIMKRGSLVRVVPTPPEAPAPLEGG
ncbi:MAG TPA: DNA gyrase subunit A, partial [Polyangiaceae bacterium]|nr:DNA gyrase subunit A [Polyangiaceae bacterium]